jgi:hypothetical protein
MFPHFVLKRVGTPNTVRGDAVSTIKRLKPHLPHRHHPAGPSRRERLRTWSHTPWSDPSELGLRDW